MMVQQTGRQKYLTLTPTTVSVILNNSTNLKISKSRNEGIELARGEYIACMDADDISLPGRFARQVAYLESHPGIGVVGGWAKRISVDGRMIGAIGPQTRPDCVRWEMCFGSPLAHPTVMMRADVVKAAGGYSDKFPYAEDYDLWRRLSARTELSNIAEYVLLYRHHSDNVSVIYKDCQLECSRATQVSALAEYLGEAKARIFVELSASRCVEEFVAVQQTGLLMELYKNFQKKHPLTLLDHRIIRYSVGANIYRWFYPLIPRHSGPGG